MEESVKLNISCLEKYEEVYITEEDGRIVGTKIIFGPTRKFRFRLYGSANYSNGILTKDWDIYYKLDCISGDNYSHDWKLYNGNEVEYSGYTGEYELTAKIVNPVTGAVYDTVFYTIVLESKSPVISVTLPPDAINGKPISFCEVPVEITDNGRIAKAEYIWSESTAFPTEWPNYTPLDDVQWNIYVGKEIIPQEGITYKDGWGSYTFEDNGTFVFDVQDKYGKKLKDYFPEEQITASVTWIDKTPPACTLTYSNTEITRDPVTVTINCPDGVRVIPCMAGVRRSRRR